MVVQLVASYFVPHFFPLETLLAVLPCLHPTLTAPSGVLAETVDMRRRLNHILASAGAEGPGAGEGEEAAEG